MKTTCYADGITAAPLSPAGVAGTAQGERLEAEGSGPPLECVRNLISKLANNPIGARTGTMPRRVCPICARRPGEPRAAGTDAPEPGGPE